MYGIKNNNLVLTEPTSHMPYPHSSWIVVNKIYVSNLATAKVYINIYFILSVAETSMNWKCMMDGRNVAIPFFVCIFDLRWSRHVPCYASFDGGKKQYRLVINCRQTHITSYSVVRKTAANSRKYEHESLSWTAREEAERCVRAGVYTGPAFCYLFTHWLLTVHVVGY